MQKKKIKNMHQLSKFDLVTIYKNILENMKTIKIKKVVMDELHRVIQNITIYNNIQKIK